VLLKWLVSSSICFGYGFRGLAPSPGSMSQLEGHLGEGKHKQDRNSVDNVEEDDLGDKELRAGGLYIAAELSILVEKSIVRKDVSDEAVESVDSCELVHYDQEYASHASRREEDDGPDPLDDVEDTHEEESRVVNFSTLHPLRDVKSHFKLVFVFLSFEFSDHCCVIARTANS